MNFVFAYMIIIMIIIMDIIMEILIMDGCLGRDYPNDSTRNGT